MRQIIKSFCDSACVCPSVNTLTVAFLVNQQKSERVRWGQYRITPSTIFPQKAPNFGSWIGVFKPNSQNQKRAYYQNYCIDSNHILHSDKDHQMPFVGGPHTHYTSKMADGRHLGKIEKLLYLSRNSSDFDKIWQADAVRPSWPIRPLKKFEISKIKDGGGRYFEKSKDSNIWAAVWPILTKFGKMMHFDPLQRPER